MVSVQIHAPAALFPAIEPLIPIGQEAGWAPEPVWKRWQRVPASAGNRTPVVQPVA